MGRVTLLAIGDVHLGTRPSSLPQNLDEAGLTVRDLGPEATLERVVELAIQDRVDAVLFAGGCGGEHQCQVRGAASP